MTVLTLACSLKFFFFLGKNQVALRISPHCVNTCGSFVFELPCFCNLLVGIATVFVHVK